MCGQIGLKIRFYLIVSLAASDSRNILFYGSYHPRGTTRRATNVARRLEILCHSCIKQPACITVVRSIVNSFIFAARMKTVGNLHVKNNGDG